MAVVKKYQGKDRRMVSKCYDVLVAINLRDDRALDTTTKTTSLSTRDVIFDETDADTLAAITLIKNRLTDVLAETKPA